MLINREFPHSSYQQQNSVPLLWSFHSGTDNLRKYLLWIYLLKSDERYSLQLLLFLLGMAPLSLLLDQK